ncbi:MAG: 4-hydroxythreonine-4-phosphate dehydrogenase PdxA [Rhizobiaceae bacterium]|nr:4-hydroxythreonine-4-phosphate dehydrogenase PdxA [Rhizobiaceae bacterium]
MGTNNKNSPASLKSIAVSIGEPAGIGPDIIAQAWANRLSLNLPHFTVIGDLAILERRAELLGIDLPLRAVENGSRAFDCHDELPVIELASAMTDTGKIAQPQNANGVIEAIERGVNLVLAGEFCALTTCPINKKSLYDSGFDFPGHTEYLASLSEKHTGQAVKPVMMLAGPELRSVPVTIHMPLVQVPGTLNHDLILDVSRITAKGLRDNFGIHDPVLAIAGLNPHAGEEGTMGLEEIEIITPAIKAMQKEGIRAVGPLPADTMFHESARKAYDVAICMYHDQALIPAKALGFDEGVNVTLGLPFIRTSPDHGTACEIAGSGKARPDSFVAALKMAADMARYQSSEGAS